MIPTEVHDKRLLEGIAETLYVVTGMYHNQQSARHHAKAILKKVRALGWYPNPNLKTKNKSK